MLDPDPDLLEMLDPDPVSMNKDLQNTALLQQRHGCVKIHGRNLWVRNNYRYLFVSDSLLPEFRIRPDL